MGALDFYKEKPGLVVLLAALLVLTVWVCIKAGKASAARRKENSEAMKKLEEYAALRHEFEPLTEEKAASAEPEKLFKGVSLGLCRRIEKSNDMQREFDSFTPEQKMLYALWFVFEDGGEKLSGFFKMNGSPLTDNAKKAVELIYGDEAAEIFNAEFIAYDENDETTSLVPEKIAALDERFKTFTESGDVFYPVSRFIIENIKAFQGEDE